MENNIVLYHHGVKGQKWGIRRFQNADGSLTAAGKKKYAKKGWMQSIQDPNHVHYFKTTKNGDIAISDKVPVTPRPDGRYEVSNANSRSAKKEVKNLIKTQDWSDDAKAASKLGQKNIKQLSNSELKKLNERTRLEQEYSRLNPSVIKRGATVAAGVAATMGTVVALYNNSSQILNMGKTVVNKLRSAS